MHDASTTPLRVAAFPPPEPSNPYQSLLHAALERRGVRFCPPAALTPRWVAAARGHVDVIHLHWLEHIVMRPGPPGVQAALSHAKGGRLAAALTTARRAGMRLVWTVHNLRPHESCYPWLDAAVARLALRLADGLIVHSRYAADRLAQEFGRLPPVWVVPHGNYVGSYPPDPRPRARLRRELWLPEDAYVYLVFGKIRRYKRIPETIAAFRGLADANVRLLVAGSAPDRAELNRIHTALGDDRRIVVDAAFVPDERVAGYHQAADAAVLGYREVFSSGALLLALSQGLPVVAPEGGTAAEVAPPPATEPFVPGALDAALAAVRSGDADERRRAARAAAEAVGWDEMAAGVVAAYRGRAWEPPAPVSASATSAR